MAIYKLNKAGRNAITEKIKRRINAVKQETAARCYQYLLDFGYHAVLDSGPGGKNGPGWSGYYAANWNLGINTPDISVVTPERNFFDEEKGAFLPVLYNKMGDFSVVNKSQFDDTVFVTNSVYYGKWLNDGGFEFLTSVHESHPNRFMELCQAYLEKNISVIIKAVKDQVQ